MNRFKRLAGLATALGLVAAALLFVWKFQVVEDWWRLRNYNPPMTVVSLANEDTMTASARHIFYVNHPQIIDSAEQFHQSCPQSEQTIVLGCYHSRQQGVAVYDIKDGRLSGVKEVTAAHEMLHAAYDRLGDGEKSYINGLLQNYYQHDLHDERIINEINSYKQTEPNELVNEMHSIFGTEVSTLPQPLERYYQRYFSNRAAVVNFANGYENEFTSRTNAIKQYDQRLTVLKQQIDSEEQSLSDQLAKIEADRARLDNLRNSGQINEYNASVTAFNGEVQAYNRALNKLRSDIAAYNDLVDKRNALAIELRSLTNALDTRLAPQTAQ